MKEFESLTLFMIDFKYLYELTAFVEISLVFLFNFL